MTGRAPLRDVTARAEWVWQQLGHLPRGRTRCVGGALVYLRGDGRLTVSIDGIMRHYRSDRQAARSIALRRHVEDP
jgi:hypothetical protein